ncbi:MAG: PACE efflux transporter [Tabrizicola sp.]|jgi:uncharacterized membrane protein|nr:PACE efflux transporter [Tabrizicola sp.]
MTLRSTRERVLQTLAYEAGGLALSIPAYILYSGGSAPESALLMLALSGAVLLWTPIHNTVFDLIDYRLSGRLASRRPQRWRVVHAISHEATTLVVTLPILIWLGGLSFWQAVLVDLGLTVLYAVYAYVFHLVYDRLRPMQPDLKRSEANG